MRKPSQNATKKTIMARHRVRKYRMRKAAWKERQSLVKYKLCNSVNIPNNESFSKSVPYQEETNSLLEKLRTWAKNHNIGTVAITDLLKILIWFGITWLPSDYRSFYETPRHVQIYNHANGKMWYNGIRKFLQQIFSTLTRDICISLNFNTDGLPLFNSSKLQFWPILMSINGTYSNHIQILTYS